MDIRISYTAFLENDWERIFQKHLFHVRHSGLYGVVSTFDVFAHPANGRIFDVIEEYGMSEKTHVHFVDENRFEFPAIQHIVENHGDFNLYMHTKGVTQARKPANYVPALAWNDYMTYFCVDCWRECVRRLVGNSCCGVEFGSSRNDPDKYHYSGNFWWASGQHLDLVRRGTAYKSFGSSEDRYLCETIVGSVGGRYVELSNSGHDCPRTGWLYFNPIVGYRFDPRDVREYVKAS